MRYGTVAGNRVSIFIPRLLYGGPQEADMNGYAHESIPFRAIGSDTGMYLSLDQEIQWSATSSRTSRSRNAGEGPLCHELDD